MKQKTLLFALFIYIINAQFVHAQESYTVSNASKTELNGTYIQSGICNGRPKYKMTNGTNSYSILFDMNEWSIGKSYNDDCYNSSDYTNPNYTGMNVPYTPPAIGWEDRFGFGDESTPPIIVPTGMYISKSSFYMLENTANNGSIAGKNTINFNNNNDENFTGTNGENFSATNKVILTNVPAGLTSVITKTSDSTASLFFTGQAISHTNLNSTDIVISFLNSAFSGGDTSNIAFHSDTLKLFFRDVLTVAHAGADFTSVGGALAASKKFDIIDIAGETFTETNLTINHPLCLKGKGADKTIIQGSATPFTTSTNKSMFELWYNDTTTSVFKNLTLQNGYKIENSCAGAAIWSIRANLILSECRILNNQAVANDLQAFAGGVCTSSDIKIYNCEFSGNKALNVNPIRYVYGGALYYSGNATIINSTFSSNYCLKGAAIYAGNEQRSKTSTLINVTIANNKGDEGAGIYSQSKNILNLTNVILIGDTAINDLYNNETTVNATNCIIGISSNQLTTNINVSSSNPLLSPLANNGGTTYTCALQVGSPAINAGIVAANITTTDQRGYYEPNGIRDIGAFEYNGILCASSDTITLTTTDSYNFNGEWLSRSGFYSKIFSNTAGCDSIVTLNLTIVKNQSNALVFDGANDFVKINSKIINDNDDATIEAWYMFNETPNSNAIIIARGDDLILNEGWSLRLCHSPNNQVVASMVTSAWVGGIDAISTTVLEPSIWYHIALTWSRSSSTLAVYVNGTLENGISTSDLNLRYSSAGFYFGQCNNSEFSHCLLDEVKVWDVVRTQSDIRSMMYDTISPSTPNLKAYYRFDQENPSTTLTDLTSNANDGILMNMDPSTDWVESYAMVVPEVNDATNITGNSFDISWNTPVFGSVENYYVEVAFDSLFENIAVNYYPKIIDPITSTTISGLLDETTYYYRVRAYKTSTGDVGGFYFSSPKSVRTGIATSIAKSISQAESISVYPNPAKQSVTVAYGSYKLSKIEILNSIGQIVHTILLDNTKTSENVDIHRLQSGIYFIKVQTNNKNIVCKIVKE